MKGSAFDTEPVKPHLASIVTDEPGGPQPQPASDTESTPSTLAAISHMASSSTCLTPHTPGLSPQKVVQARFCDTPTAAAPQAAPAETELDKDAMVSQEEEMTTDALRKGWATRVTMAASVKV